MENRQRKAGRGWWGMWVLWLVAVFVAAGLTYGMLVVTGISSTLFLPPYPPTVGTQCGTIYAGERGASGTFGRAEQCLWEAYQTCHSATLVYSNAGLDFTLTHAVTLQKSGRNCAVTDATQGVGGNGHTTRNTYQCTGLEQQSSGLVVLGCGSEGNVVIPSAPN